MTTDSISPDLKTVLRRLTLSRMLDTLPERLTIAFLSCLSRCVASRHDHCAICCTAPQKLRDGTRRRFWRRTVARTFSVH
jgi:hypothetical protein